MLEVVDDVLCMLRWLAWPKRVLSDGSEESPVVGLSLPNLQMLLLNASNSLLAWRIRQRAGLKIHVQDSESCFIHVYFQEHILSPRIHIANP